MKRPVMFIVFLVLILLFRVDGLFVSIAINEADRLTENYFRREDDFKKTIERIPSVLLCVRKSFYRTIFRQVQNVSNNILNLAIAFLIGVVVTQVITLSMVMHAIG